LGNFAYLLILLCFLLCSSCNTADPPQNQNKQRQAHGEYLYRLHEESFFVPPLPERKNLEAYPWEKTLVGNLPKLTKEYFRCKGSSLNLAKAIEQKGEIVRCMDCGGSEKHSLPLRQGKEYIYQILIDILNYIQLKTGKRVVVTSGHRCPEHNLYVDSSLSNQHSKHLIGAEVSFYVQGLEDKPEHSVKLIQNYYKEEPKYKGQKEFEEFKRYEKEDTDVSTLPWYNKEIFIKLYTKKEGRDFDNRHPYPYLSIQVRYDRELNEKVIFSWDKANKNYFRK
jgi:hypothetical protein